MVLKAHMCVRFRQALKAIAKQNSFSRNLNFNQLNSFQEKKE